MQPVQPVQPVQPTVQRVTSPAGDPAWLVGGYDAVKRLLSDPRLGRSHPNPERASRYSNAVIFGQPMAATRTSRLSTRRCAGS